MGLLDQLFGAGGDDPRSQANMAIASGLLSGNFAGGLLDANQVFAGAKDRQLKRGLLEMDSEAKRLEIDKAKRALANEQGLAGLMPQYFNAGTQGRPGTEGVNSALPPEFRIGAQPPIAARGPQFDVNGYTAAAMQNGWMDPLSAIKLRKSLAPESQINKLDVKDFTPASVAKFNQTGNYGDLERLDKLHFADTGSGISGINQFTGQPVNTVPKSGDPFKDLVLADGQGGLRPNSPLIGAKQSIAKSGAARTDVRVENKMGESLAGQVGPMVKDSRIQTDGAVKMFDAADRIEKALNSDKVIAGPGAGKIQTVRQFAQMVGGGNDEGIRQTRQVVKSLAQMAVEARKQLQGQGQVTESEAKAVMKADAGEIDDMTVGELRDLVALSKRAAHFTAKGHSEILNQLGSNSGTAGLVPFYKVPRMDELLKHEPKLPQIGSQPALDDILKKYGGK